VAINIAKGLQKLGYDISYSGLQTSNTSEWNQGIEILPCIVGHVDDITQTIITMSKIKPDVVLAIIQMDMDFNGFAKLFPKTVVYCPVESKGMSDMMTSDLLNVKINGGLVVAQTMYGKNEIESALASLTIPYIYHGFDPETFYPISGGDISKESNYCYYKTGVGQVNTDPIKLHEMGCYDCRFIHCSKCSYYKEEMISILRFVNGKWAEENIGITALPLITKGKMVFLFVGQNLGVRKRIERLLKAYSLLVGQSKQMRDNTILHLHCMPMSVGGINLIKVVQDLGIQNNIVFSYGSYRSSGWSDSAMNILYNSVDVNVSASSGEGFSLPVIEGMACGLPMIAPNCSSFTELIGNDVDLFHPESKNRGLLVDIESLQMIQDSTMRALVNENDLALKMRILYTDNKLREKLGNNAVEWSKNFKWEDICKEWDSLLKKTK
jgi:glycosyltransferase involved in cell wall biosynthesis